MDKRKYTYGLEIELADIDKRLPLLPGTYTTFDPDVCNSWGEACDPENTECFYGAEINTTPQNSILEMTDLVSKIFNYYSNASINHRAVLHGHIGWSGIDEDLEALKRILIYSKENGDWILENLWKYTITASMNRHTKHFLNFDRVVMPDWKYDFCMQAKTPLEFKLAHQKVKDGRVLPQTTKRYFINLFSVFQNGSIEFRHFFPTTDLTEIKGVLGFITRFVNEALGDFEPVSSWGRRYKLPSEFSYDPWLEECWQKTNYKFNTREEVAANKRLLGMGRKD
jgi:hypothetical protein